MLGRFLRDHYLGDACQLRSSNRSICSIRHWWLSLGPLRCFMIQPFFNISSSLYKFVLRSTLILVSSLSPFLPVSPWPRFLPLLFCYSCQFCYYCHPCHFRKPSHLTFLLCDIVTLLTLSPCHPSPLSLPLPYTMLYLMPCYIPCHIRCYILCHLATASCIFHW